MASSRVPAERSCGLGLRPERTRPLVTAGQHPGEPSSSAPMKRRIAPPRQQRHRDLDVSHPRRSGGASRRTPAPRPRGRRGAAGADDQQVVDRAPTRRSRRHRGGRRDPVERRARSASLTKALALDHRRRPAPARRVAGRRRRRPPCRWRRRRSRRARTPPPQLNLRSTAWADHGHGADRAARIRAPGQQRHRPWRGCAGARGGRASPAACSSGGRNTRKITSGSTSISETPGR